MCADLLVQWEKLHVLAADRHQQAQQLKVVGDAITAMKGTVMAARQCLSFELFTSKEELEATIRTLRVSSSSQCCRGTQSRQGCCHRRFSDNRWLGKNIGALVIQVERTGGGMNCWEYILMFGNFMEKGTWRLGGGVMMCCCFLPCKVWCDYALYWKYTAIVH